MADPLFPVTLAPKVRSKKATNNHLGDWVTSAERASDHSSAAVFLKRTFLSNFIPNFLWGWSPARRSTNTNFLVAWRIGLEWGLSQLARFSSTRKQKVLGAPVAFSSSVFPRGSGPGDPHGQQQLGNGNGSQPLSSNVGRPPCTSRQFAAWDQLPQQSDRTLRHFRRCSVWPRLPGRPSMTSRDQQYFQPITIHTIHADGILYIIPWLGKK